MLQLFTLFKQCVSLFGLVLFSFLIFMAEPSVSYAEGDEDEFKSLADITEDVVKEPDQLSNVGQQWGQLGGTSKFLVAFTKSSKTVSYDDLESGNIQLSHAGKYGFVLDRTGLDHSFTSGEGSSIYAILGRMIVGGIVLLGYAAQSGVSYMFGLVTQLLDWVNVFKWVANSNIDADSPFKSLHAIVNDIYTFTSSLGMLLATLGFVVAFGISILGWRVSSSKPTTTMGSGMIGAAGRFLFRMFIIIASPLLIASFYSSMLSGAKDAYSGMSSTDYAIYSNLVDFEAWAKHSRLALPTSDFGNGELVATKSDGKIPAITHRDILILNAKGAGLANAQKVLTNYSNGYNMVGEVSDDGARDVSENTSAMITRWMLLSSAKYTSADFEAYARSSARKQGLSKDAYTDAVITDGGLASTGVANGRYLMSTGYPQNTSKASIGSSTGAGLSTLGMYNYLSTVFSATSMTFIDTESIVGQMSTPFHASVGLAGRGFVAIGNGVMMISLVYSLAILGFMFAMFAINALIASIPKIIANLAASSFGSPIYFVKLLVAVFVVVVELFGGALIYAMAQRIIIGLSSVSDDAFGNFSLFTASFISPSSVMQGSISTTLYGSMNIVSGILLLWVTFYLISLRGKVLAVFGHMIENALNNVLGIFDMTRSERADIGNNMHTVGSDGQNQFSGMDGVPLTSGALSKGQQTGGRSLLGKSANLRSDAKDAMNAEEARKGRPLTKAEKLGVMASQGLQKAGLEAMKATAGGLGSGSGVAFAEDLDDRRRAKISDGLAQKGQLQAENERAMDDALSENGGVPDDVASIRNYADALEAEGLSGHGEFGREDDGDASVSAVDGPTGPDDGSGGGGGGQAQDVPTLNDKGDYVDTDGSVVPREDIPTYASQDDAASDVVAQEQAVHEAKQAVALAKTPQAKQQAERQLAKAQANLQRAQAGQHAHLAQKATPFASRAEGARGVEQAKQARDNAMQTYAKTLAAAKQGKASPRDVANAKQMAVQAQSAYAQAQARQAITPQQSQVAATGSSVAMGVPMAQVRSDGAYVSPKGEVVPQANIPTYRSTSEASADVVAKQQQVRAAEMQQQQARTPQERTQAETAVAQARQSLLQAQAGEYARYQADGAGSPQATVAQAQALVASTGQLRDNAVATLAQAQASGASPQELKQLQAKTEQAQVRYAQAESNLAATTQAVEAGTVTGVAPLPDAKEEAVRVFNPQTSTYDEVSPTVAPYTSTQEAVQSVAKAHAQVASSAVAMSQATNEAQATQANASFYGASAAVATATARQATMVQRDAQALVAKGQVPMISETQAQAQVLESAQRVDEAQMAYQQVVAKQASGQATAQEVQASAQQLVQAVGANHHATVMESAVRQSLSGGTYAHDGVSRVPVVQDVPVTRDEALAQVVTAGATLSAAQANVERLHASNSSASPQERQKAQARLVQAQQSYQQAVSATHAVVAKQAKSTVTQAVKSGALPTIGDAQQQVSVAKSNVEAARQSYVQSKLSGASQQVVDSAHASLVQSEAAYMDAKQNMTMVDMAVATGAMPATSAVPTTTVQSPQTRSPQQPVAPTRTVSSGGGSAPSTPIAPTRKPLVKAFVSVHDSNEAVSQKLREVKQLGSLIEVELDDSKRQAYTQRLQQSKHALKQIQTDASNYFLSQPSAVAVQDSRTKERIVTNEVAQSRLLELQTAFAHVTQLESTERASAIERNEYKKAQKDLRILQKEVEKLGVHAQFTSSLSGVRKGLTVLHREHQSYIHGTAKPSYDSGIR